MAHNFFLGRQIDQTIFKAKTKRDGNHKRDYWWARFQAILVQDEFEEILWIYWCGPTNHATYKIQ